MARDALCWTAGAVLLLAAALSTQTQAQQTTFTAQFVTQRVDHFNSADQRTFQQRWYNYSAYAQTDELAFFYVGGEEEIDPNWMIQEQIGSYAQALRANLFILEHRYYGQSYPTQDLSVQNLQWLTLEQVLADWAAFIQYLIDQRHISQSTKVVMFGSSYSGALAVWMRLKYPNLVYAAVGSSATVVLDVDATKFLEVVTEALKVKAGTWCADNVKKGYDRMVELVESKTAANLATVSQTFRVCNTADLTNTLDKQNFYSSVGHAFNYAVIHNRPKNSSTTVDDITEYCNIMSGDNLTPDQAMQKLAQVTFFDSGLNTADSTACADYNFNNYYGTTLGSTSRTSPSAETRVYYYQLCTQVGGFQTDDSSNQIFGQGRFPLSFSVSACQASYGASFNLQRITDGINKANTTYGGAGLDVTRVIFVNGELDPFRPECRTEPINCLTPAILIKGAPHGLDASRIDATKDSHVLAARTRVQSELNTLLTQTQESRTGCDLKLIEV